MVIIGLILCIFFVLVISLLVKSYNDDIKELEDRVLQLEKRIEHYKNDLFAYNDIVTKYMDLTNDLIDTENKLIVRIKGYEKKNNESKECDCKMACKKGGKKK